MGRCRYSRGSGTTLSLVGDDAMHRPLVGRLALASSRRDGVEAGTQSRFGRDRRQIEYHSAGNEVAVASGEAKNCGLSPQGYAFKVHAEGRLSLAAHSGTRKTLIGCIEAGA